MTHIPEAYLGAPDLTDPHSAYSEGKHAAETLCTLYAKQYINEMKIARCNAFMGPYLPLDIHFAIGNFSHDGLNGGPINEADSSVVYIEVPDANRNVDFVDSPFQDFDTEHINHFSNPCLHNFRRVNRFEPLQGGEKTIPVSINKRYPAIFHFARKTGDKKEILPDTLLKQKILALSTFQPIIPINLSNGLKKRWMDNNASLSGEPDS